MHINSSSFYCFQWMAVTHNMIADLGYNSRKKCTGEKGKDNGGTHTFLYISVPLFIHIFKLFLRIRVTSDVRKLFYEGPIKGTF